MRRLMKQLLTLCLAFLLPAGAALAQDQQTAERDYLDQLPPLIDRELFFGDPEISGAQLSPDGEHISFRKPYRDVMNIWVKETGEPFDAARPVTADTTRPVSGYFWSEDSQRLLYVQDKGGNENYHVYAVDPTAEAEEATGVPPAQDLTPYEDTRATIVAVPEETPGEIVVGLNDRDARWHDVYRLDLASGERELLIENDAQIAGWQTDLEGNVRLATRTTEDGGTEILRVNDGTLGEVVYTCTVEETCSPIRFHRDGERVYMETNAGDTDLTRLVLFNPETQEEEVVESDPENQVDFGGAVFSDRTDELIATYYTDERRRYYPKSEQFEEDLALLEEELPEGDLYFGSSTEDETKQIVRVSRDVDPGSTYLYDRESGEVELLYRSRPELPSDQLAEMEAIRYTARDGLEIPAFLTLPKGVEPESLSTVIMPHGGPWSRDTWSYDSYAQFLANRGYAVLQPNFRGSTGYGKEFLNAGNKEWGEAMQDDITDGVEHLIDEGIADPDRVGIYGGSYGGYATLAGLAFTPDLYAAGVSYVGPSNLLTLLNSIPPYWASVKRVFDVRVGDPEDPEDQERLREQSPLFAADQIEAPLMVVQGANDPRVKQQESDQIVVALHERGFDVEYLVAPDEGHGFAGRDNRMAVAAAMEEFLARHLGGRYQESMEDAVAERLEELRVDPGTVTLPDSLEQARAEEAQTAPLPDADGRVIEPVEMTYRGTLQAGGQEMQLDMTRTVASSEIDGRTVWQAVDATELPMGTMNDTSFVDEATLRPVRRSMGGMGTATLDYTDEKITGEIGAQGQTMEIDADLEAPVLDGGPGQELFIAGLPLEEGYETTLRTFNPQQQAVQPLQLEVTGATTTEVPAGTYDTYVVELTSMDEGSGGGATLYVTREAPHYVVRGEYRLPAQMGSGTMTAELVSMEDGTVGETSR